FDLLFFFFQAEDGIRDRNVTGVQTCALPILARRSSETHNSSAHQFDPTVLCSADECLVGALWFRFPETGGAQAPSIDAVLRDERSEERRVGKECRARGAAVH